ncbi:MAG: hypothetical protein ACTHXC_00365 [Brachybacterium sp.]
MTENSVAPRTYTPAQAAEALQVPPSVLKQMRMTTDKGTPTGPPFLRIGHRTVRYPIDGIEAYLRGEQ